MHAFDSDDVTYRSGSTPPRASAIPQTRGYQQEMLEESLRNNIIIAMDTGSGKTHIAILRLKIEAEREPRKISWFLAPTVTLCDQQHAVIEASLAVPVGLITGALEPDQWKDADLWKRTLESYRVVVSTPQVLLDALHHAYIVLGRDIGLLIFDEAHHAVDNYPYNRIMQDFYFMLPPRMRNSLNGTASEGLVRPMILGLTASPIYGGNVDRAFQMIEKNLDSFIRAPRIHRDELSEFVYRPTFKHTMYDPPDSFNPPFSTNLAALEDVVRNINIENDPYVHSLRHQLAKATPQSKGWHRLDQKLSKVITKEDSFTHKGLRDFLRTAEVILNDLGAWAADWYVWRVLEQARLASDPLQDMMPSWQNREKEYLLGIIRNIQVIPISYQDDDILEDVSYKVIALIQSLLTEMEEAEARNDRFSGLVFVERRDVALALTEVLQHHPFTRHSFQVGLLLGTSDNGRRHSFLDITRHIVKQTQAKTLMDFKIGERNLIISTAVAEEGIDVQACGCVIRWDPPPNMASWAQSRGRARKKQSTFTLMFERGSNSQKDVEKWENLEREMVAKYNDPLRDLLLAKDYDPNEGNDEELEFRVESTGALLTLQSAIPHLNHFCAVMPSRDHVDFRPIYDLDPPDYPMGWHDFSNRSTSLQNPYQGPWGATVTLPRTLPDELRVFRTKVEHPSKTSAQRHAAFLAYITLYRNGLLSDQLLPITDHDIQEAMEDIEKRVGMADVQSGQINPWMAGPELDHEHDWFYAELVISDLPPLYIITRTQVRLWTEVDGPILYLPTGENMQVTLRPLGRVEQLSDPELFIEDARKYTFMLFSSINGSRMDLDRRDFSYLFYPVDGRDDTWKGYMDALDEDSEFQMYGCNMNALEFGEMYDFPEDIAMVRDGARFNKPYQFIDWYWDQLTEEETEELLERYGEIEYPLIKVRPFHPRTNFLSPRSGAATKLKHKYLIAKRCFVVLLSPYETQYAFLLPSVIRALSMALTTQSLRRNLFGEMSSLSIIPDDLLTVAITAPVSQERRNYQRLETLGDTVLKFIVVLQLLAEHPAWPEGYLTKAKDHAVSNGRLANENLSRNVFQWIIRDRMLGKKWKPDYEKTQSLPDATPDVLVPKVDDPSPAPPAVTEVAAPSKCGSKEGGEESTTANTDAKKKKKRRVKNAHQISTKVLADVIEALIGAAFSFDGFTLAYECTKFFGLGLKNWLPLPERIDSLLHNVREPEDLPPQVGYVERILDYTFSRKMLLIEALTHPTYQQSLGTISYERLEFLGDAILDMICTEYLFKAEGKEYSPGHMHMRKSAMVNAHMLAFLCLRACTDVDTAMPRPDINGEISLRKDNKTVYLEQCLFHSSPKVLEEQRMTLRRFERRREEIEQGLTRGEIFPWAALTRLQAPKFFSDMMESLIGAIFLDSEGNFDVIRRILSKLGFMQILTRIVEANVDVLHPVSRVSLWAQQNQKKVEYRSHEEKGKVRCTVVVDGEPLEGATESDVKHGKGTLEEVKFAAAEKAIVILRLRTADGGKKKLK